MLKLVDGITELFKKVATSLPPDIESALKQGYEHEDEGTNAKNAFSIMLENTKAARTNLSPICQDTGVPIFFVRVPAGISQIEIKEAIIEATRVSTEKIPLRPNAVDVLTGINSGNNIGEGFPVIYLEESGDGTLVVDLMLKGSGSENIGKTYTLPDESINAQRDLEGVQKCVIDAVFKAQGKACPPYTIGVGIGATKDQVAVLAKKQLLRKLGDRNPLEDLDTVEQHLLDKINDLSIGPVGFGGKTTALGIKIGVNHRHPGSYFVDIAISCWANRRGRLLW